MKKLLIELVPKSSWYSNVRSNVKKSEWDRIRKKTYKRDNYKCRICGESGLNQGFKWPVECHEVWKYDDKTKTQILTDLISLCPLCHKVKHPGLANLNNEEHLVVSKLKKVNDMTTEQANNYLDGSFEIWKSRSKNEWKLDISFLDSY